MLFARNVSFQIKNGKEQDFVTLMNTEVLPQLKKQEGFRDEFTLINKDRGMGISLWNDRKSAETWATNVYPEIARKLSPVLESTPKVELYDVGVTTVH